MKGYIYKIENKTNGTSYIGQTSRNVTERFHEHFAERSNSVLLKRAIKKYGKENFVLIVLCEINTENKKDLKYQLDIAEIKYIKDNDTLVPNGYNLVAGGGGCLGYKWKNHPWKGKKHTEESKEKIAAANRGLKRPHMAQHMDKIHEAVKKPIKCNETGQIWSSVMDCAAAFNVKPKQISRVLKGQRKRLKWYFTFSYL
jgi:group I intron endonuclease